MSDNINIRPATHNDIPALREVVTDIFVRKERMNTRINLSRDAFLTVFDQLSRSIDENTSYVAEVPGEGIIAFFLTSPMNSPFDASALHPDCAPPVALNSNLIAWFLDHFEHIPGNKILHCLVAGTKNEYEGKGLVQKLTAALLESAKKEGYELTVVECSSPVTQHIMRDRFGFIVGKEIVYDEFELNGEKPFAGMDGCAMLLYRLLE